MITMQNVRKTYGNFTFEISMELPEGQILGLIGKNGAGKSTTMNMITGYIEPTEGEIKVEGYDISKKPKKAKAQIGYMPEGVPLYSDLTVKEFVTYMAELKKVDRKTRKEKVEKIAKKKAKELQRKAEDLVDLAKEKGTPVLEGIADDLKHKVICVCTEVINKLEKGE